MFDCLLLVSFYTCLLDHGLLFTVSSTLVTITYEKLSIIMLGCDCCLSCSCFELPVILNVNVCALLTFILLKSVCLTVLQTVKYIYFDLCSFSFYWLHLFVCIRFHNYH